MTPGPGIEPGTHWWKASTLTTAPTLLRNEGELFEGELFEFLQSLIDIYYSSPLVAKDNSDYIILCITIRYLTCRSLTMATMQLTWTLGAMVVYLH